VSSISPNKSRATAPARGPWQCRAVTMEDDPTPSRATSLGHLRRGPPYLKVRARLLGDLDEMRRPLLILALATLAACGSSSDSGTGPGLGSALNGTYKLARVDNKELP